MTKAKYTLFILLLIIININPSYAQYRLNKVVIDAGHGGKDPGALGKKGKEKEITLSLAKKVGNYIEEKIEGVEVIYTRSTDEFISLHERANIANKNKADLFISIHVNANTNPDASGTDSWVMGYDKSEKNLEVAKLENQVILVEDNYDAQYQGLDPNSTEAYIIFELMQNIHLEQSLNFAYNVQDQFANRAGRKNRGVNQAPFFVLWNTNMPSVLIETGFITNVKEEEFLLTDEGQDYMASAIFRAFRDFKIAVDKKSNAPRKIEIEKDSIYFSVQILSSKKPIPTKPENFKNVTDVYEIKIDDTYKYLSGKNKDYTAIETLKTQIKKQYPEAFIVAFKNGLKIPTTEALELLKK
ncbi:MAG: N-acetylmuramoyl-L-alanine amidase [Bacteroidales bacterium]|nr:N-acetylmuramoyl-L-alanine amidase [Bacteroidales bacterium]